MVIEESVGHEIGDEVIEMGKFGKFCERFDRFLFGDISFRLRLIAKIVFLIFAILGVVAVVLTVLLAKSLGVSGVIVAVFVIIAFESVGYAISAFTFGYARVVENSGAKSHFVVASEVVDSGDEVVASDDIEINEFPEF